MRIRTLSALSAALVAALLSASPATAQETCTPIDLGPAAAAPAAAFGSSVAVDTAGEVLLVGALSDETPTDGDGVYVFRRADTGDWREQDRLTARGVDAGSDPFARTVAVGTTASRDGKTYGAVATWRAREPGVYAAGPVLTLSGTDRAPRAVSVDAEGRIYTVSEGYDGRPVLQAFLPAGDVYKATTTVALTGTAIVDMVAAGLGVAVAQQTKTGEGIVAQYELGGGGGWTLQQTLTAADLRTAPGFGGGLAGAGGTLVVGSPDAREAVAYRGGDGGGWKEVAVLTATDAFRATGGGDDDEWTYQQLLTARDALLSAGGDGGGWEQVQILTARDAALRAASTPPGDTGFWSPSQLAAAAERLTAVLDALQADTADPRWIEAQVLTANDLVSESLASGSGTQDFGQTVAVSADGSQVVVGARGAGSGYGYVYARAADGSYALGPVLTISGEDFSAAVTAPGAGAKTGTTVALATPTTGSLSVFEAVERCAAPVDSDGDGVEDGRDACPEKPGGDRDYDGDGCPDDRAGVAAALRDQTKALFDELAATTAAPSETARVAAARRLMLGRDDDGGAIARFARGRDLVALQAVRASNALLDGGALDTTEARGALVAQGETYLAVRLDEVIAAHGVDHEAVVQADAHLDAGVAALEAGALREALRSFQRGLVLLGRGALGR